MLRPTPSRLRPIAAVAILAAIVGGVFLHGSTAAPPPVPEPVSASPWGADYFPNVTLITQHGKEVRFFDDLIRGKVVVINFIFTSCSAACPLETARLREVKALLGDRVGRDVFFYSISIDPLNDTPAVLKAYAERFDVGPDWLFLTGGLDDVYLLREKLGLYAPGSEQGLNDHNLSLIVGNQATGRWQKVSPFENPHILASLLGNNLHNWKQASTTADNDYADAPVRLPQMSRGEELFRTRCVSCHTLGGADAARSAQQAIGPDLTGVTRVRERAWLSRWIREPDRMLAEADPLAMSLYNRYNRVAMPNLRLNEIEVAALIEFLDAHPHPQPLAEADGPVSR